MFFADTATFKNYCSVNISFEFSELSVYLKQADRDFLIKNIGATFFNYLQNIFDTTTPYNTISATPRNAMEKLRYASAAYAIALWIPLGQTQIDGSGIRIANTENLKTAFKWQIDDMIKALYATANSAMEDALKFFADNTGLYPQFASSPEFTYYKDAFIASADEFTKYFSQLGGSRINFLKLKSCMSKAEDFGIKPVLFPKYYATIKANIAASSLTSADINVLPLIKKAVTNLTIARAINELAASFNDVGFMVFDNTKGNEVRDGKKSATHEALSRIAEFAESDAKMYLSELRIYLEANKINYPDYTSDPGYKVYDGDYFKNDPLNNYFFGG